MKKSYKRVSDGDKVVFTIGGGFVLILLGVIGVIGWGFITLVQWAVSH